MKKLNLEEISNCCHAIRKKMGYSINKPVFFDNLLVLIDKLTLVKCNMSFDIFGMIYKQDTEQALIAINSRYSFVEQRLCLAHELYHYYYSEIGTNICNFETTNTSTVDEINANNFAEHFLLPTEGLIDFLDLHCDSSVNCESVLKIAYYFMVPFRVVINRLHSLGYFVEQISENNLFDLFDCYGFEKELFMNNKKQYFSISGYYFRSAYLALQNNKISENRYDAIINFVERLKNNENRRNS